MSSSTVFSLPLATGVVSVPLNSGAIGQFEITINGTAPTTGTLKVEGLNWSGNYDVIEGASAINLATALAAGPFVLSDFGHWQQLRFTLTGVTGGVGTLYGASVVQTISVPDYVSTGGRALNIQTYIESNTKLGSQFYFQITNTLAASGTFNMVFTTGSKIVLVKSRSLYTNGVNVSIQLFKAPTGVSGGSSIAIQNYNDINPVATSISALSGATITGTGTAWGSPEHIYNSSATGQRSGSGLAPSGDRVLKPGSTYLVQIQNGDTAAAPFDYFLTWFEGQPDLPRQ